MPSIWSKMGDKLGKYLVVRRDGSVPHWPHFVLGARDPAAAATLRFYADQCDVVPTRADPEYTRSIRQLADDFDQYRAEHGLGDPPAPKHRKDNTSILALLNGQDRWVRLTVDRENSPK